MARNEEKHYGRLNRLYLMKEKEEYEKANPKRPRLDLLYTPEEIQKWLPSIKKEIDFYLKKSQVTCYSDAHVEDCHAKVVKLEKEFKAFIRKMKQLSTSPLEAIPWTNRPYKRRKSFDSEESIHKEFKRIDTPILDEQENQVKRTSQCLEINYSGMDEPLNFSPASINTNKTEEEREKTLNTSSLCTANSNIGDHHDSSSTQIIHEKSLDDCIDRHKDNRLKYSIVNYDSSDSESS